METKIKWNEGEGYITATYEGSGSGSASISSDVNEGIDREQSIKVETTDKSVSATLVVSQEGLREIFEPSDGLFVLANGGTFNVLKVEEPTWRDIFKEVEYLESTGTQYIKTGVNVTPDYTVEVTFMMTQRKATWDTLFGTRNGNAARFTARWANSTTGKLGVHRSKAKSSTYESIDDANATKTMVVDTWHTVKLSKREYTFDGELRKTFSAKTDNTAFPYQIYLFALCNAGSAADYGYFRIKKARIWNDKDELIRDYIPCVNLDGVGGMYDVVNDTFTKSGSSTKFNVGNLV